MSAVEWDPKPTFDSNDDDVDVATVLSNAADVQATALKTRKSTTSAPTCIYVSFQAHTRAKRPRTAMTRAST